MTTAWSCPKCKRIFTRANQRHACGTGNRTDVLRKRSPELVKLYGALEKFVKSLGSVEIVARERYVLFRTRRIFADLVVMSESLRVAIHLGRRVEDAMFVKIVADRRQVTHVVQVRSAAELRAVKGFLREAYRYSSLEKRAAKVTWPPFKADASP